MSETVARLEDTVRRKLKPYARKDPRIGKAFEEAKVRFAEKPLLAHNWEHTLRDAANALTLLKTESANPSIVLPAIIFHDVGFLKGATGKTHAAIGAEMAPEIFPNLGFTAEETQHISNCIRTHKGSMLQEKPETTEAKVVCDADLLEKYGPLGIVQTITTYNEFEWGSDEFLKRADKLETELQMETETGKKLAAKLLPQTIKFWKAYQKTYTRYLK